MDLLDVLESLCNLFTKLCRSIKDLPKGKERKDIIGEFGFLFGGWSWREQKFGIWELTYSSTLDSIEHSAITIPENSRVFRFLGDDVPEAEADLEQELKTRGKLLSGTLDMEPLVVLANMARTESEHPTIGGSLQIAKVYRSGHSEYFGIVWPSAKNGERHFLGREINPYDAPPVRFLDPDSGGFIDLLPSRFGDLLKYDFGPEKDFVEDCYAKDDFGLKDLSDTQKVRLIRILKEQAYDLFLKERSEVQSASESEDGATMTPTAAEGEAGNDSFPAGVADDVRVPPAP
jgi:hypothetical protein